MEILKLTVTDREDNVLLQGWQISDRINSEDILVLGIRCDALQLNTVDIFSNSHDHQVNALHSVLDSLRYRSHRVNVRIAVS